MAEEIKDKILNMDDSFIKAAINQQIADLEQAEEDPYTHYNDLALYFGEDFVVKAKGLKGKKEIHIKQPTIQNYIDVGEDAIYSVVMPFVQNTTSCRVQLWDHGIDWNKISDWELFIMLFKQMKHEYTKIFFADEIDFSSFELFNKTVQDGNKEIVLYNSDVDLEINEQCYKDMSNYMRYMFRIFPEEEFVSGKRFKQEIIDTERLKILRNKQEKKQSNLLSLISFCVNHPGFKYKKNELREVGIVEFMDSVQRLQIYESTKALINGSYSGFCDLSKIPKENFNFLRSIQNGRDDEPIK